MRHQELATGCCCESVEPEPSRHLTKRHEVRRAAVQRRLRCGTFPYITTRRVKLPPVRIGIRDMRSEIRAVSRAVVGMRRSVIVDAATALRQDAELLSSPPLVHGCIVLVLGDLHFRCLRQIGPAPPGQIRGDLEQHCAARRSTTAIMALCALEAVPGRLRSARLLHASGAPECPIARSGIGLFAMKRGA